MEIECVKTEHKNGIRDLISTYKYGRYLRDPTLPVKGARELLFDQINEFYSKYPDTTLIAKKNEDIVGLLGFKILDWDSEHFGIKVASIDYFMSRKLDYNNEISVKEELLKRFNMWGKEEKVSLVSTRVDDNDLSSIHALEDNGFHYMENLIHDSFDYRKAKEFPRSKYELHRLEHPLQRKELDVLAKIGKNSFRENRFNYDPRIKEEKALRLYEKWVKNSCNDPSKCVFIIDIDNEIVAFFIYTIKDLSKYFGIKFGVWYLAAVSPKFQGKGIGYQLYLGILNILKSEVTINDAGYIIKNIPMINLYGKLGFKHISSEATFHKWI